MQPYSHFFASCLQASSATGIAAAVVLRFGAAFRPHFVASKNFSNFWSIGQQQQKGIHSRRGAASKNCSFFHNTASTSRDRLFSTRFVHSVAQQEKTPAKMSEITHPTIKGKSLLVTQFPKNCHHFHVSVSRKKNEETCRRVIARNCSGTLTKLLTMCLFLPVDLFGMVHMA